MRTLSILLPFLFISLLRADASVEAQPFKQLLNQPPEPWVVRAADPGPVGDDAPLDQLTRYWMCSPEQPSARVQERFLQACEQNPELIGNLLGRLATDSDSITRIKAIWAALAADQAGNDWRVTQLHDWLRANSDQFRDELVEQAQGLLDSAGADPMAWEAVETLARRDWSAARGIVLRLEACSDLRLRTLGNCLHYAHAQGAEPEALTGLRRALGRIAEDPSAPASARSRAIEALLSKPWEGWEDWYLQRFQDPSLILLQEEEQTYLPLQLPVLEQPERWYPELLKLLEGGDATARDNAINALMALPNDHLTEAALRPLVPWLLNAEWFRSPLRSQVLHLFASFRIPEAVPAMLSILATSDNFGETFIAAEFLTHNPEAAAIPLLRAALNRSGQTPFPEWCRTHYTAALYACGGLEEKEALAMLSAYALWTSRAGNNVFLAVQKRELSQEVSLGWHLSKNPDAQRELSPALLKRARSLQASSPALAEALRKLLWSWPVPEGDEELIRRLDSEDLRLSDLTTAIAHREALRARHRAALQRFAWGEDWRAGLAAALLEDPLRIQGLLAKGGADARLAIVATARILHLRLPLGLVALLALQGRDLALAADQYLKTVAQEVTSN